MLESTSPSEEPENPVGAAAFLVSDDADCLARQSLNIDGGDRLN